MSEACSAKTRSIISELAIVLSVTTVSATVVGQIDMGPASCPAEIHCIAVFALKIANFQGCVG